MPTVTYPNEDIFRRYVGIDFSHGSTDCYGLIRKVYAEVFRIDLKDYARPDEWWEHPETYNLYKDNIEGEGFRLVESDLIKDREVGDIILMAIQSTVPCHGAIYIGDGKILHHFYGRKSCIENYCRLWKNTTTAIYRHKDLKIEKPVEKMELSEDARIKSFMLLQQQRSRERRNNNQQGS